MLKPPSTFVLTLVVCFLCQSSHAQIHVGHTRAPFAGSPYLSSDSIPTDDAMLNLALSSRFEHSLLRFEQENDNVNALEQRLVSALSLRFSPERQWALLVQTQFAALDDGLGLGPDSPLSSSPSLGRSRLAARYTYHSAARAYSVSLQPEVLSPSSSENPVFGGPDWLPSLSLLVNSAVTPKLNLAQSIRYEHRSNRAVGPLNDSPVWMLDLGSAYLVTDRIALLAEAHVHHHRSASTSNVTNSASFDVGVNVRAGTSTSIKLGYSKGLSSFPGTPESAVFIGVDLQTTPRLQNRGAPKASTPTSPTLDLHENGTDSAPPNRPKFVNQHSRTKDTDKDGVRDSIDLCPTLAEDLDGHDDIDGCPDPDNDGDGHLDSSDKAPNDPEDFDGYEDHDGRPDPDNDGDGISDGQDLCPNHAGHGSGCPESVFDWRAYTARQQMLAPQVSVTLDAIFAFPSLAKDGVIQFDAKTTAMQIAEIADHLKSKPDWSRVNVVGSYCSQDDNQAQVEAVNEQAQLLATKLIEFGVSEKRIGYLATPRFKTPRDSCNVYFHVKRLQSFEGIGNQSRDARSKPSFVDKSTVASTLPKTISVKFVPNKEHPTADTAKALIAFAKNAKSHGLKFILTVHTDSLGKKDNKQILSEKRAAQLEMLLIHLGLPAAQFQTRGLGGTQPIATNKTREGRRLNNRVEIEYPDSKGQQP